MGGKGFCAQFLCTGGAGRGSRLQGLEPYVQINPPLGLSMLDPQREYHTENAKLGEQEKMALPCIYQY